MDAPPSPDPAILLRAAGQHWLDARFAESTAARESLSELEGRRLAIEVEGAGISVTLRVEAGRMLLDPGRSEAADAVLRGTPIGLARLGRTGSAGELRETGTELVGSVHVADRFARTLRLAGPDLEAELAGWLGDMLAHEVATSARAGFDWLRRAFLALEQNTAEYLTEEQALVARSIELTDFFDAVDRLRDDVDRAAKRIERLESASGARS